MSWKLARVGSRGSRARVSAWNDFSDWMLPITTGTSGRSKNPRARRLAAQSATRRRSDTRRIGSGLQPAADEPRITDPRDREDQRHHPCRRRTQPHVERRLECRAVGVPGGYPRRVARTALRDREDLVEHHEREGGAEDETDRDDRAQQRQRDVPEAPPSR